MLRARQEHPVNHSSNETTGAACASSPSASRWCTFGGVCPRNETSGHMYETRNMHSTEHVVRSGGICPGRLLAQEHE